MRTFFLIFPLFLCLLQCRVQGHVIKKDDDPFNRGTSDTIKQKLGKKAIQDFDYYVFTQTWPVSTCIDYDYRECTIPSNVTSWIVHGLWPNTKTGDNPSYCNNSYPFNDNEIVPLWSVMAKYWTNLFTDSKSDSFWEHEWEKHGTCAMITSYINSEFDYFSYTLNMYLEYNVHDWLRSAKIYPSDTKGLNFTDVYDVITNNTGGKQATIQCKYNDDDGSHFISAIEVCLDKLGSFVDCQGSSDQGCPLHESFVYPKTVKGFKKYWGKKSTQKPQTEKEERPKNWRMDVLRAG